MTERDLPEPIDFSKKKQERDLMNIVDQRDQPIREKELTEGEMHTAGEIMNKLDQFAEEESIPEVSMEPEYYQWISWQAIVKLTGRFPEVNPNMKRLISANEQYSRPDVVERLNDIYARIESGEADVSELMDYRRQLRHERYGILPGPEETE